LHSLDFIFLSSHFGFVGERRDTNHKYGNETNLNCLFVDDHTSKNLYKSNEDHYGEGTEYPVEGPLVHVIKKWWIIH